MRDIIFMRTHFFDEAVEEFYRHLVQTSQRPVVVICDETRGRVDIPAGVPKISISREHMASMGLHAPDNFGWLCGDYFYYAGFQAFPRFDRYWLIESDVRIKLERTSKFFNSFENIDADLLAFHMYKAGRNWFWHSPMSYFSADVYSCIFPVTALSNRSVEHLFEKRKAMSDSFQNIVPSHEERRWPNDESFVVTTLEQGGFVCESFNNCGKKFTTDESFGVGLAKSHRKIKGLADNGLIYHPVHSAENFVGKAHNWLGNFMYHKASPEKIKEVFNEDFIKDIASETNQAEADRFREKLNSALERA